jgi:Ferritin-like
VKSAMPKKVRNVARGSALESLKSWFRKALPLKADETFHGLGLPPRPRKLTPKQFAVRLLRAGAEIEHSLAVQYLYAAYSIDETSVVDGNITSLTWKTHLRLVAREEMAHLITVQNLLLALGEPPHLNRAPLHRSGGKLALPFRLERLGKTALEKFVLFESPAPDQLSSRDADVVKEIRESLGNKARLLLRVGSIYAAVYWLFMKNDDPGPDWPFRDRDVAHFKQKYRGCHLSDRNFVSRNQYKDKEADAKEWGIFEASTHADQASPRETALASLRWIMLQGEGPNAIEESHFYRFLDIYKSFDKVIHHSPSLIINVPRNPRVASAKGSRGPGAETGTVIRNRGAEQWGALFNLRYQLMLLNIRDALGASRRTAAERRQMLAGWATVEMEFLKKIGQALPRMHLRNQKKKKPKDSGSKNQGLVAGAPFQGIFLPDTVAEREKLRRELLDASDQCVAKLRDELGTSTYTGDLPTAALVPGLLDAVGRRDDEMRRTLE